MRPLVCGRQDCTRAGAHQSLGAMLGGWAWTGACAFCLAEGCTCEAGRRAAQAFAVADSGDGYEWWAREAWDVAAELARATRHAMHDLDCDPDDPSMCPGVRALERFETLEKMWKRGRAP